jgi:hypothetical protein
VVVSEGERPNRPAGMSFGFQLRKPADRSAIFEAEPSV